MTESPRMVITNVELQPAALQSVSGVVLSAGGGPLRSSTNYISSFCCWDGCGSRDCGLCMYATCCPYCAYVWHQRQADIMANIEAPTCCCPVGFGPSLACITSGGAFSFIFQLTAIILGLFWFGSYFMHVAPCISCTSRSALRTKYGLSDTSCCCPCCAHYCCQTCALYQESVYVKHVLRKEPSCCCYACCKDLCGSPEPGVYRGAPAALVLATYSPSIELAPAVLPVDTKDQLVTTQPQV